MPPLKIMCRPSADTHGSITSVKPYGGNGASHGHYAVYVDPAFTMIESGSDAENNSTSIEIWQPSTEERLAFVIPGDQALETFYHPFAHLPVCSASCRPQLKQEHARERRRRP